MVVSVVVIIDNQLHTSITDQTIHDLAGEARLLAAQWKPGSTLIPSRMKPARQLVIALLSSIQWVTSLAIQNSMDRRSNASRITATAPKSLLPGQVRLGRYAA